MRRLVSAISAIMSVRTWRTWVPSWAAFTSAVTAAKGLLRARSPGVVEPDMDVALELVDRHGAALDDVGAVVDQYPQLTRAFVDAVPVQTGRCDRGVGGCGGVYQI